MFKIYDKEVNREPWPDLYTQGCGCSADNAARGLDIFRASDAQESQSCSESAPGFQILRQSCSIWGENEAPETVMKDIFYILSHRTISPWLDRHHVCFSLADTIVNHPYFSLMVHFELTGTMFAGDVIFLYDSTRGFIQCKTESRLPMLFIRFMCTRVI